MPRRQNVLPAPYNRSCSRTYLIQRAAAVTAVTPMSLLVPADSYMVQAVRDCEVVLNVFTSTFRDATTAQLVCCRGPAYDVFADCQRGDAVLLARQFFGLFDTSGRKPRIDGRAAAAIG